MIAEAKIVNFYKNSLKKFADKKILPTFALAITKCVVDGAIAQLVEQRTENPCVPGSNPGGTTKNHSKKMKTSEFQRIQRFSFCFNCAKHADLGISIVPNSWLFFEPLKKATI